MNWELLLSGAVGAGLFAIAGRLVDAFITRNKAKAETGVLKSEASENITEAAKAVVEILVRTLTIKEDEGKNKDDRIKALEDGEEANKKLRIERDAKIAVLEEQFTEAHENNEALQAALAGMKTQLKKDQAALSAMREQIEKDTEETSALRKQVAEMEEKYREMEEKYRRMRSINEKMVKVFQDERFVKALTDANIPLPDFNGDLTDSIRGWKWGDKQP